MYTESKDRPRFQVFSWYPSDLDSSTCFITNFLCDLQQVTWSQISTAFGYLNIFKNQVQVFLCLRFPFVKYNSNITSEGRL